MVRASRFCPAKTNDCADQADEEVCAGKASLIHAKGRTAYCTTLRAKCTSMPRPRWVSLKQILVTPCALARRDFRHNACDAASGLALFGGGLSGTSPGGGLRGLGSPG